MYLDKGYQLQMKRFKNTTPNIYIYMKLNNIVQILSVWKTALADST